MIFLRVNTRSRGSGALSTGSAALARDVCIGGCRRHRRDQLQPACESANSFVARPRDGPRATTLLRCGSNSLRRHRSTVCRLVHRRKGMIGAGLSLGVDRLQVTAAVRDGSIDKAGCSRRGRSGRAGLSLGRRRQDDRGAASIVCNSTDESLKGRQGLSVIGRGPPIKIDDICATRWLTAHACGRPTWRHERSEIGRYADRSAGLVVIAHGCRAHPHLRRPRRQTHFASSGRPSARDQFSPGNVSPAKAASRYHLVPHHDPDIII